MKKTRFLAALLFAAEMTAHLARGQDLVVDGGTTNITSGTVTNFVETYVGQTTSGNQLNVLGGGTVLSNSGNLYVGFDGSSNSLVISNGGSVVNTFGFIGLETNSSNNSVLVTGTNSRWTNNSDLFVGQNGSSNSLVISNGGSVANRSGFIGLATNSSNNSVLVTGTNSNGDRSTWTNSADLNVGYIGDSNSLVVSDGGAVNASIIYAGFQPGANHNQVIVGSNSTITTTGLFDVGHLGSSNSLVITNGGDVVIGANGSPGGSSIGSFAPGVGNSVEVTGPGSTLSNAGIFYVGFVGTDGLLTVSNQGSFTTDNLTVGNAGDSNRVVIADGGNVLVRTNLFISAATNAATDNSVSISSGQLTVSNGTLNVGRLGQGTLNVSGGTVSVSNLVATNGADSVINFTGGTIISRGTTISNAVDFLIGGTSGSGAEFVAQGGTHSFSTNLIIGDFGDSNLLVVTNGATVNAYFMSAGFRGAGANDNEVIVGSNSTITVTDKFDIGHNGFSNSLIITDGGDVFIGTGGSSIGSFASAIGNSVEVTGPGSTLSNAGIFYVGFVGTDGQLTVSNQGSFTTDDLTVGNAGDSNRVVIADGGNVLVRTNLIISALAGASNNSVSIGSGQLTVTNGTLNVGAGGLGTLSVSGGTVTVSNLVATNGANSVINFTGGTIISSGTTISNAVDFLIGGTSGSGAEFIAQGGTHLIRQNLWVGDNGSGNSVVISDGGTVANADGYIGYAAGSSNNSVTVTGTNLSGASTWSNGIVTIGNFGSSNSLIISNGGKVLAERGGIGAAANSSNNIVTVTGAGSRWTNAEHLFVGSGGNANRMVISNGGVTAVSSNSYIGFTVGSSNNSVLVTGTNANGDASTWNSGNLLAVGFEGGGNRLDVSDGGNVSSVSGVLGVTTNSSGNNVLVTGARSTWSNSTNLFVGLGGSSNSLVISNGGEVTSVQGFIGFFPDSSNNSVTVTGLISNSARSSWIISTNLEVGVSGSGNTLTIDDGASVQNEDGYIGSAPVSSNNSVLVTGRSSNGVASTWSNRGFVSVGSLGSGNSLFISNGAAVHSASGLIGMDSSNNSVTVTGNGSRWTNNSGLFVGQDGSSNSLVISNGGSVANTFGNIGAATSSSNNSVLVTGTNSNGDRSTWTNSDALVVGVDGTGNGLVISNGGSVVNTFGVIGEGTNSSNNFAVVTGADSTWANSDDFYVGYRGSGNSLVISNGGEVASAEGYIGLSDTASSNSVMVTDGGTWTNSGNLRVGFDGSGNSLVISNGGKVANGVGYIGRDLIASNNSVLVTGAGSIWTNSGELYVGFGSSGNSLTIAEGGTLAASNIIIASQPGSSGTLNIGRFGVNGPASTIDAAAITFGDGDGVINFNQNNTVTISSVISGNGAINQLGTGRSILSGANTYTGPTTVSAGTLVAQSQTALGTGAVSLLGGTLELQSQLDIGALFWDGAATIRIADPGAGHFVNLGTNSLTLSNGLNNFDLTGAVFPNTPVKLMTSTNMSTFSTNDFGVVGANRYRLLIQGDTLYISTLPTSYQPFAVTPNQREVAQALDNFIGAGGDRGTVSAALDGLSASQYPAAFEQMMPSQYASLPSMAFNVVNALNSSLFQRLWVIRVNGGGFNASGMNLAPMQAEMGGTDDMGVFAINPSKDTKWSSFVDGNGIFANASGTGSVQNYRSQSGGVSTGAAYSWTDAFATGVYVGYQGLQAEYDSGKTIDNAVRFGVFGTYDIEDFYFNALVGGAYHGYTVNRYINFGGLDRTATGRPGAGEFNLALGTGYDFQAGDLTFGPFTTLQYTYLGVQGFTETGADALNLDVSPYDSSSLLYTLGAQAAYNWRLSDKVFVTPMVFAGWQHEFLQNGYTINSSFATGGPAAPFNYNTSSPARDNFYGGAGVTVGIGERWQATFIYSAFAANENNSSQNLYLGVGYKF